MTWLGEIGKIYRDLVQKYEIRVKILLKMAIFKDSPPIFCLNAEF